MLTLNQNKEQGVWEHILVLRLDSLAHVDLVTAFLEVATGFFPAASARRAMDAKFVVLVLTILQ